MSESERSERSERSEQSEPATAPRVVCEIAAEHSIASAFGIVSVHNQPLVDGLVAAGRYTSVRHEATAVNAADGYSRVADSLGLAVTSTGTGAGNAAGSLVEALTAGSRVLHVTGNIDSVHLGEGRGVIHETKAQDAMLDAVSKTQHTITDAAQIESVLRRATDEALAAPTGPVSVEIPIDLQYASGAHTTVEASDIAKQTDEITGDLERAVAVLNNAERPVVWAGGGAVPGREAVAAFCRRFSIPLITSNAGRGIIAEGDPLVIGNFAARTGGQDLLDQADALLSIGTHFRSNETRHYKLRLPSNHVQIDVDPAAIGRSYPCEVGLVGDAATVISALSERLDDSGHGRSRAAWLEVAAETAISVRRQLEADIGPYAELCRAMRDVLPDESPLVRDVTIPASAWGNRLLPVLDPTTNVNARGGGIGQGLGMAIGAATARPDVPTALMVGDGGLAVHLGELATLAQEQLPVVIIVFNDGGYGVLRNLQDAHIGRRSGVDLFTPDFAALAAAFSMPFHHLADPGDSQQILTAAVADGSPAIVEVDCDSFGPMPVPFVPPVPVP